MEEFTENRLDELKGKRLVSGECGVPSGDTFRCVLESVNPDQLHRCLVAYGHDILDELAEKQIVIDGKKIRGTSPSLTSSDKGLYTLNVWVAENEICIGQHIVHDKTNEITVIPQALAALDTPMLLSPSMQWEPNVRYPDLSRRWTGITSWL